MAWSQSEVIERVERTIVKSAEFSVTRLTPEDTLDKLGVDLYILGLDLDEEFDMEIDLDAQAEISTVQHVIDFMLRHTGVTAKPGNLEGKDDLVAHPRGEGGNTSGDKVDSENDIAEGVIKIIANAPELVETSITRETKLKDIPCLGLVHVDLESEYGINLDDEMDKLITVQDLISCTAKLHASRAPRFLPSL